MEPIEFLGITFRSSSHLGWFIFTSIIGINCFLGAWRVTPRTDHSEPWVVLVCLILFSILEFSISVFAISETESGTINGPEWSVDCIWWNAFLGFLLLILAIVIATRMVLAKRTEQPVTPG